MSITRLHRSARMSQVVVHGGTAYLAGQVPDDCSGDIGDQTQQVLRKIDLLLAEIGISKSAVLSAQIWLADISDFQGMNTVWDAWVDQENPPARATCQAGLVRPQGKIEILITAAANV
ncbi:RidA family protein [Microvirga makkahensis]|uniref:RidA family protein n=1 Tax=Microvirga makkahensis TaxID=1128670 RepID=A0A7X3SMP9_9HYPH|nr:RidA family protein [Microvirga makkahensis]MXQ10475.1 RidA family protein [Microvirga makkahensis]